MVPSEDHKAEQSQGDADDDDESYKEEEGDTDTEGEDGTDDDEAEEEAEEEADPPAVIRARTKRATKKARTAAKPAVTLTKKRSSSRASEPPPAALSAAVFAFNAPQQGSVLSPLCMLKRQRPPWPASGITVRQCTMPDKSQQLRAVTAHSGTSLSAVQLILKTLSTGSWPGWSRARAAQRGVTLQKERQCPRLQRST